MFKIPRKITKSKKFKISKTHDKTYAFTVFTRINEVTTSRTKTVWVFL